SPPLPALLPLPLALPPLPPTATAPPPLPALLFLPEAFPPLPPTATALPPLPALLLVPEAFPPAPPTATAPPPLPAFGGAASSADQLATPARARLATQKRNVFMVGLLGFSTPPIQPQDHSSRVACTSPTGAVTGAAR